MMKRLCSIVLGLAIVLGVATLASAEAAGEPTFNADVAPILFENCTTCHRPGQVAPMSLTSYAETRPWARAIKSKVVAREMPPWHADPRYGAFQNVRSLSTPFHKYANVFLLY